MDILIGRIRMRDVEIELMKNQIRNMLRNRRAGDVYDLLIELADECKETAIQYGIDKDGYECEKYIPLNPSRW